MILALVLAILAFALNVADALLTDAIIARRGREKNPVIAASAARVRRSSAVSSVHSIFDVSAIRTTPT
ncbi:MAG: hypothetical protein WAT70_03715 [Rhizobiaceae bacterium]